MICAISRKNLIPPQRELLSSKTTSSPNSKMLQSPLEISDAELLPWRSLSRRSSPSWISNDNWTASQIFSFANMFASSSLLTLCNFVVLRYVFHVLHRRYSPPDIIVKVPASRCNSQVVWILVCSVFGQLWTLPLMSEHFSLLKESPSVIQSPEAIFPDPY